LAVCEVVKEKRYGKYSYHILFLENSKHIYIAVTLYLLTEASVHWQR